MKSKKFETQKSNSNITAKPSLWTPTSAATPPSTPNVRPPQPPNHQCLVQKLLFLLQEENFFILQWLFIQRQHYSCLIGHRFLSIFTRIWLKFPSVFKGIYQHTKNSLKSDFLRIRYSEILDYSFSFPLGQHSLKNLEIKKQRNENIKKQKFTSDLLIFTSVWIKLTSVLREFASVIKKSDFTKSKI